MQQPLLIRANQILLSLCYSFEIAVAEFLSSNKKFPSLTNVLRNCVFLPTPCSRGRVLPGWVFQRRPERLRNPGWSRTPSSRPRPRRWRCCKCPSSSFYSNCLFNCPKMLNVFAPEKQKSLQAIVILDKIWWWLIFFLQNSKKL